MRSRNLATAVLASVAMLAQIAGPVTDAQASAKGIKSALKRYEGKIIVAEKHVVAAESTYETSKDPAPVIAAIEGSVKLISQLRGAIAHQGAAAPRVKEAKHLLVAGLTGTITAYGYLKTAFGERATNEPAAKAEAEKAVVTVKRAKAELKKGARLLA